MVVAGGPVGIVARAYRGAPSRVGAALECQPLQDNSAAPKICGASPANAKAHGGNEREDALALLCHPGNGAAIIRDPSFCCRSEWIPGSRIFHAPE